MCLGMATVIPTTIGLISSHFNVIGARCRFVEAEFLISIAGNIFSVSPLYGSMSGKRLHEKSSILS